MSDPLSIAAAAAGLLGLAGTVSKSIFQFVASIVDAPEQAQNLARELAALNVAVAQMAGTLLDPKFASAIETGNDDDVIRLHACLHNSTAMFSDLEKRVNESGLAEQPSGSRSLSGIVRRSWESVKWSFTDDDLREFLRRIEAEKVTLVVIHLAFTMKLAGDISGRLKETTQEIRTMNRTLKNVQVTLQWMVHKAFQQHPRRDSQSLSEQTPFPINPPSEELLESSVFTASTTYKPTELAQLLQDTGSVFSLTLEKTPEDTVAVLWSSDQAAVPQRLSAANIRPGAPSTSTNLSNLFDSTEVFGDVLSKIEKATSLRSRSSRSLANWVKYADLFIGTQSVFIGTRSVFGDMALEAIRMTLQQLSHSRAERYISDIQAIERRLEAASKTWEHFASDGRLAGRIQHVYRLVQHYVEYLQRILIKPSGVRGAMNFLNNPIIKPTQDSEYDRLHKTVVDEISSLEDYVNGLFVTETMRFQKEQREAGFGHIQLLQKIDMLSEKISRLETDSPKVADKI
ncbi:hypothetical protein FN846DRAFT_457641 [Sphaerosporella brunnea]|uniref:Fungal N-terminal domain-containing protein n=1 Tax=Sphaerosporella brunnea TaxID=1250544 RepID=A0A5J5EEB2_9PEZI|nr:hypothetical protein FN846DRAFT_457641 [Sphaerosporella brunnea]